MFVQSGQQSGWRVALRMCDLIYHTTVRDVRKTHRYAFVALLMNILQTVIFVLTFYVMFSLLGIRGEATRGDYLLYLMSGIMLFLVHAKTVGAVVRAEGSTSAMMQHAPLNTLVTVSAAALSALYLQLLSMGVVLFVYHTVFVPITIDDPAGAMGMLLIAWLFGVGVGLCLAALKPWFPEAMTIASSVWSRANMIASGKMFVANSMPGFLLVMFDWNPLFHTIDQARGYIFLHYTPLNSDWHYALWVSVALIVIGLMAENYTRRHASASWSAAR